MSVAVRVDLSIATEAGVKWPASFPSTTNIHVVLLRACQSVTPPLPAARYSLALASAPNAPLARSTFLGSLGATPIELVLCAQSAAPPQQAPSPAAQSSAGRNGIATPTRFEVISLLNNQGQPHPAELTAVPLVIPDNFRYDATANTLTEVSETRGALVAIEAALEMVRKSVGDEPVAALCVAGSARTGKSYLLSRAAGNTAGFELGHTMDACTYGIWIGTKALRIRADGKPPLTVLLLDTEGVGHISASGSNDIRIFTLSILLSSVLVYNTLKMPTAATFDSLGAFTELASSICINSANENIDNRKAKLKEIFPSLVWLFRDCDLPPPAKYGSLQGYIDYLLTEDKNASRNAVRQALMTFNTFKCHSMPPPGGDVTKMDVRAPASLEPKFETDLAALFVLVETALLKRGSLRSIDGSAINGSMFATLCTRYVTALAKEGAVPEMVSSWQATVNAETRRVLDECVAEYGAEMKVHEGVMPLNTAARVNSAGDDNDAGDAYAEARATGCNAGPFLLDLHVAAATRAYESLARRLPFASALEGLRRVLSLRLARTSGEPTWQVALEQHLRGGGGGENVAPAAAIKEPVDGEYCHVLARNKSLSETACRAALAKMEAAVSAFVRDKQPKPKFAQVMDFLSEQTNSYLRAARGPSVDACLDEWSKKLQETLLPHLKAMDDFDEERVKMEQDAARMAAEHEKLAEQYAAAQAKAKSDEQMRAEQQKQFERLLEQMKADQQQQMEAAEERYKQMLAANMQEMVKMNAEEKKAMQEQMTALEGRLAADAKTNQDALKAMSEAIARMPPPPAPVHHSCCVSMHGSVEVRGRGVVRVRDVQVGDAVASIDNDGRRVWTDVYWAEMRGYAEGDGVLVSWGETQSLLLTADHLMYVVVDGALRARAAKQVRAGDVVKLSDERECAVRAVERVRMRGLATLLTLNHAFLVDGALVSCYELSVAWGALESLDARLMYQYAPWLLRSSAYRWFCGRVWDEWSESVFKRMYRVVFGA